MSNNKKLTSFVLTAILITALLFIEGIRDVNLVNSGQGIGSSPKPSSSPAVLGVETLLVPDNTWALVTKAVDGDTIEVKVNDNLYKVRYIGIDTPETVDPRRPVGCFGKEASDENKSVVTGKQVLLTKDITDKDKYGRLLRYVYLKLDDGQLLFVNEYLVKEGYAQVYTYPPDVKFNQHFIEAQNDAREKNLGLWAKCPVG